MRLISTKWPRPPDPRSGLFCARGFEPTIAGPWRWTLYCETATGFMADLARGVTLGFDGFVFGGYAFSAITDSDPFGLFVNFWALNIVTRNEPDATTFGSSVDLSFTVITIPGVYFAASSLGFVWPSSRSPFNLGVPFQSPFGVDLFHGDCFLIPAEWDTPIGVGPP